MTLPEEDHVPSDEDRVRVIVGPYDPDEQYQVYKIDDAIGDGLIAFV